MSNDFSSKSVADLRQMLVDSGKYTQEEADTIKGKSNLVEAVLSLNGAAEDDNDGETLMKVLSSIEKEDTIVLPDTVQVSTPSYHSPEWHEYVMSKFSEDELQDEKYPNIFGLRRVAELLLGNIIQSGPTAVYPPEKNNGCATCVYTVVFLFPDGERAFSAVGGASPDNVAGVYSKFPEAISEVRAEARALRKALKLKIVSSEEMPQESVENKQVKTTDGEWKETDSISAYQTIFIDSKCKELKIDLGKFLKHSGYDYESLDKVTRGVAAAMIELLNKYQTNTKKSLDVPEDIKLV